MKKQYDIENRIKKATLTQILYRSLKTSIMNTLIGSKSNSKSFEEKYSSEVQIHENSTVAQ